MKPLGGCLSGSVTALSTPSQAIANHAEDADAEQQKGGGFGGGGGEEAVLVAARIGVITHDLTEIIDSSKDGITAQAGREVDGYVPAVLIKEAVLHCGTSISIGSDNLSEVVNCRRLGGEGARCRKGCVFSLTEQEALLRRSRRRREVVPHDLTRIINA
jgi:hypothetical protein